MVMANRMSLVADISANTLEVLLGEGDGTFEPAKKSPAGSEPFALVTADFNGDHKLDAAALDLSGSVVPTWQLGMRVCLGTVRSPCR